MADVPLHAQHSIDTSADALLAVDVQSGRFVDADETAAELLGYAPDEWSELHYLDLCPPTTRSRAQDAFARVIDGCPIIDEIVMLRHREGHLLWAELSASAAYMDGRCVVQGRCRIPARANRTERQVARPRSATGHVRGTAEYSNAAHSTLRTTLRSDLAHDMRASLTKALGYTHLLGQNANGNSPDVAGRIREANRRVMQHYSMMATLLQADAASLEKKRADVEIAATVETVADHLQEKGSVEIELRSPKRPIILETSEWAFQQAVHHLLSGATDLTNENFLPVAVRGWQTGAEVRVEIPQATVDPLLLHQAVRNGKALDTAAYRSRSHSAERQLRLAGYLADRMGGAFMIDPESDDEIACTLRLPRRVAA